MTTANLPPTDKSSLWYYAQGQQAVGPIPLSQLQQLETAGRLQPGDMVLKKGEAKWVRADTVPGLFAKPQEATACSACKKCQRPLGRETKFCPECGTAVGVKNRDWVADGLGVVFLVEWFVLLMLIATLTVATGSKSTDLTSPSGWAGLMLFTILSTVLFLCRRLGFQLPFIDRLG